MVTVVVFSELLAPESPLLIFNRLFVHALFHKTGNSSYGPIEWCWRIMLPEKIPRQVKVICPPDKYLSAYARVCICACVLF